MEIPEGRYVRRAFLLLVGLSFILLGLLQFAVIPYVTESDVQVSEVINDVLTGLLTSLIGAAIVAFVIYWIFPRKAVAGETRAVAGRDRDELLENARRASDFWWFTGGLGRYNRVVVLPEFAQQIRRSNQSKSVVLIILDPNSSEVCERYARLRAGRRSGRGQNWSADVVRNELIATVVSCRQWQEKEPLLDVEIRFKMSCSLSRVEVGATRVVVTSEDPGESALTFEAGSGLYGLYREEFRLAREQSRLFVPPAGSSLDLDESNLLPWLRAGGISDDGLDDADIKSIVDLVRSRVNPYA